MRGIHSFHYFKFEQKKQRKIFSPNKKAGSFVDSALFKSAF